MRPTAAQFLVTVAALVVVIAGMKAAEELIVPFLLAVFIAIIISPVYSWLRGRSAPPAIALGLMVCGLVAPSVGAVVGGTY